jgi:hypothetical protein
MQHPYYTQHAQRKLRIAYYLQCSIAVGRPQLKASRNEVAATLVPTKLSCNRTLARSKHNHIKNPKNSLPRNSGP